MITVDLAARLRAAGVRWRPANGDRFHVPDRELDDQVFVVSDMVIEVLDLPTGPVFGFNGTTEWALDSLEQGEVVWLPREEQLRTILGDAFVALERRGGEHVVRVRVGGSDIETQDADVECAYAKAVLAGLE